MFISHTLEVKKGKNTNVVIKNHRAKHPLEPEGHMCVSLELTHTPITDIGAQLERNPKLCIIRKYKPTCKQAQHLSM